MNVLEIGTGSGYSAAILAELVGPTGQVTTVDIDSDLSNRAQSLYTAHGYDVAALVADGMLGHPRAAPYDRILVGATPPAIPHAWLSQLRPGGILLTGAHVHDLPGSYAIARVTTHVDPVDDHRLEIHPGGYTPMTAPHAATASTTVHDPDRPRHSLAATGETDPQAAQELLACLRNPLVEPWTSVDGEYLHLKNWILAADPDGLIEATTAAGTGVGIGVLGPGHAVHAAVITDRHLLADAEDSSAAATLRGIIRAWYDCGAPRTQDLQAYLAHSDAGWLIRFSTQDTQL